MFQNLKYADWKTMDISGMKIPSYAAGKVLTILLPRYSLLPYCATAVIKSNITVITGTVILIKKLLLITVGRLSMRLSHLSDMQITLV